MEQSTLDALAERVQTFEHWVYEQCLSIIDGIVQEQVYSSTYELAYPLLNMDKVRTELLPENVIQKMEGLLEESEKREEKERSEKEQAQANEAKAQANEAKALEELEKAKQKLRDAGLE